MHSMEALISQAVQKKLNIVMIQELNYRFFYLLQDLLQKAQNTQVSLTTFDWRESTWYMRHEEWEGTASQILSYIKKHFKEPLLAKEVAARFFISPVYVGRVIQQASGETFKQYVNRLKMEEAKQLLSSSDQLVYEIAEELGFKDSKYFISRFTEETGMSPAEYRRKKGN